MNLYALCRLFVQRQKELPAAILWKISLPKPPAWNASCPACWRDCCLGSVSVDRGLFRKDLYSRLNTIPAEIPPLRRRGRDILLLLEHIKRQIGAEFELSPEAERLCAGLLLPLKVHQPEHRAVYRCFLVHRPKTSSVILTERRAKTCAKLQNMKNSCKKNCLML